MINQPEILIYFSKQSISLGSSTLSIFLKIPQFLYVNHILAKLLLDSPRNRQINENHNLCQEGYLNRRGINLRLLF